MIHYLPIENIEQRYTKLMNKLLGKYVDFIYYPPEMKEVEIKKGQFLDIERTIQFKAKQLDLVTEAFSQNKVKDGDWFLVGDMYYPGIESIKYMAELQGINIRIAGFNYAGRADETDFVQQLGKWSDYTEKGYHEVCDIIFVGSNYHKNRVVSYFGVNESKVIVTGYVWDSSEAIKVYNELEAKEDFVIWPHRICKEKGIEDFLQIANAIDKQFLITSSNKSKVSIELPKNVEYVYGLSKKEYYQYMSRAEYYLSTAYQETFGYTLREALMYNCVIAVPSRACYPEMVSSESLYSNIEELNKLLNGSHIEKDRITEYDNNAQTIVNYLCKG